MGLLQVVQLLPVWDFQLVVVSEMAPSLLPVLVPGYVLLAILGRLRNVRALTSVSPEVVQMLSSVKIVENDMSHIFGQ